MRDFETDFDFDSEYFDAGVRVFNTNGMRKDSYKTVTADKTAHSDNDERKARVVAHQERIQREMQELDLKKGDRE